MTNQRPPAIRDLGGPILPWEVGHLSLSLLCMMSSRSRSSSFLRVLVLASRATSGIAISPSADDIFREKPCDRVGHRPLWPVPLALSRDEAADRLEVLAEKANWISRTRCLTRPSSEDPVAVHAAGSSGASRTMRRLLCSLLCGQMCPQDGGGEGEGR